MSVVEIRHFHLFCGLGCGAKGFNQSNPRVGTLQGEFRCLGGIDVDATAIANFQLLTGVPGTIRDLMSAQQYEAFHGHPPPTDWKEATPADIQNAAGGERPHIVFLSAPCKGFSGLLSQSLSTTAKYQALNELTLRGIWLALEAWRDDPPELLIFENVPRIANRGRHLLEQITQLLRAYGYAVSETTHDCGEIGGLAQSRRRFLLVARHEEKVPPFLYEPPKKTLRAVGDILGAMPLPGNADAGPMHRIPSLQWKTWVRLAFVEAGKDWRSLNRLKIENGYLKDFLIMPEYRPGYMGVNHWDESMGTVAGRSTPTNGAFSVADPRYEGQQYSQFGVLNWRETTGVVTGQRSPGQGRFSVADPRSGGEPVSRSKYRVTRYNEHAGAVIAASTTGEGAFSVADPRPGLSRKKGDSYLTAGHYGVVPWQSPAGAVSAAAGHDNGRWTVADPRPAATSEGPLDALPAATDRLIAEITALDGTWHRPFTTLELAALQSLIEPEEYLELHGKSDSVWREQIGNAVPAHAARAIGDTMGETLLLAWTGETFVLSPEKVWVQPLRVALSVDQQPLEEPA
ncbi:DNA cytosine methyltransferase [Marinobacter oulmenensis]|uniref:Site-specific DNA-cytosine methylase n=1 Tax=Marinobacter oulmenensis TaxID=643747 RepID=A0A840UAG0_9GAMM|nr:DNA cytosine methyltransferase [Marinobacter oulmenensis]MBB5321193.1 site-specific DNA-cytosine methylase [Marinobacter oulmenensis]